MTSYFYACTCGHTGSDDTPNKTDAASPSAKHQAECGRVVLTGTDPQLLARAVEKVGRL